MRTVIAGAGAIGAYIGAKMTRAGQDVVLFARGPHYRAMNENGVRVISAEEEFVVRPTVVDNLEKAGKADVVFLGVKAHGLPDLAPHLHSLVGPNTVFVSTQNGIPWWYFQRLGGEWDGTRIERVDPAGVVSAAIDASRVVGSLVYFATEVAQPGVVRHLEGNRMTLGEPDGSRSERLRIIAEMLVAAGLRAPVTTRIRHEIWVKILGNASLNPISALTGATLVRMLRDPDTSAVIRNMMQEVEAVAHKFGIEMPISIEQRMAGAEKIGEHKTSMLQDLESGRPLELEALTGAVLELSEKVEVPMPHTRAIYACTKLLANCRRGL
jgi:2-dehydropantoate 2-reductase